MLELLLSCSEKKDLEEWNKWRRKNFIGPIWLQDTPDYLFYRNPEKWRSSHFLSHAYLKNANLNNVHLEGMDLIGANLEGATLHNAHLESVLMHGTNLKKASAGKAHFENASLQDADMRGADIYLSHFEGANLSEAHLESALLENIITCPSTLILDCSIDKKTYLGGLSIDNARISPSLQTALKTNIRRKEWQKYYKKCSFLTRQLLRFFWWLSDYGSSSSRILSVFLLLILAFASIYLFIEVMEPSILTNIKHLESPNALLNYLFIAIQSLCFALSTMVTLGFANVNISVNNLQPLWSVFGLVCVSLNLLAGYFFPFILVTRLGMLFQSLGPEQGSKSSQGNSISCGACYHAHSCTAASHNRDSK